MNVALSNPLPATHPSLFPTSQPAISPPQRPAKPSEKPRLRQIPSAEDLETDGGGVGPMANDGLEHRESGRGPPEGRGSISLQQHQQVWLCPRTLKKLQPEGLGLGIGWGREGDRKSSKTHARMLMRMRMCVHVCVCECICIYSSSLLSQVDPVSTSWPFTEPHILHLYTSRCSWLSCI
jgi:hypothetical protein